MRRLESLLDMSRNFEEDAPGGRDRTNYEDMIATMRLIFGYSEILKQQLQNSFHMRASEDVEKISRAAWSILNAWEGNVLLEQVNVQDKVFDAERFMEAFSHIAHVHMSRSCSQMHFFCPVGFGSILGDEDALLDLCTSGLDFLQANARPDRISVHLFPSQIEGKDYINIDIRAQGGELTQTMDPSFATFFHSRNPLRIQRACQALDADFSLDVCQGRGLTFSVTFPDRFHRGQPLPLSRTDDPQPAILLLGTDAKVERMVRDVTRGVDLEVLTVLQVRSGLRVFFEKQPEFVIVDASNDDWAATELIESIRRRNSSCFIVSLVERGMGDMGDFPGANVMFEKPLRKEMLLESIILASQETKKIA